MQSGYIFIHNEVLPTLLAISMEEQQRGLMFEEWPPPIMTFVYGNSQINKFWMKNTISPLDILFCKNGKISQIYYGEPNSLRVIGNDEFSDLVIELPHGMVEDSNFKIGQFAGIVTPEKTELQKIIAQKTFNFYKI